jgi:hypothetical protein
MKSFHDELSAILRINCRIDIYIQQFIFRFKLKAIQPDDSNLIMNGVSMREIRTTIEIAAPRSKVWNILMDFEKWSEWSPIINKANGTAALGSKLKITMCGRNGKEGNPGPKYEPVITVFEENKRFNWRATMMAGFMFSNGKVFELKDTSTGTQLIHIETFSGIMVPLMWSQMESTVPQMLNSMNEALKKKVEKH